MLFTTVLKDNGSFMRCYKKGRYTVCGFMTGYFFENKTPYNRIGITVSKKLGNAVVRNRIKRIVRAGYRNTEKMIPLGYDIVFVARNNAGEKSSRDVENFILKRLIPDMNSCKKKNSGNSNRKSKK